MKRIRKFRVTSSRDTEVFNIEVSGWHKAWDLAIENMRQGCSECRVYDAEARHSGVVASFSDRDMQAELEDIASDAIKTRWRTEPLLKQTGMALFANHNTTEFGWSWVEGATHDLPYRLGFFEKGAERNPDGLLAFVLGLRNEAMDLLRKV